MSVKRIAVMVAAFTVVAILMWGLLTPKGGALPESGDLANAGLRDVVKAGARLVDVRTAAEFEGGHIEGAENVPMESLVGAAASWDKNRPIALYCQTGARSANAYGYLVGQGFTNVYNLKSGIAAWDGAVTQGSASGVARMPATSIPTVYDFSSDT